MTVTLTLPMPGIETIVQMSKPKEIIERAIYAALGCTDIRRTELFDAASKQIASFVLNELDGSGFHVSLKGTRKITDHVGKRLGRVVITKELPRAPNRQGILIRRFECKCDCGKSIRIFLPQLSGKRLIQSCGCIKGEKIAARNRTHGLAGKIPEYNVWQGMKSRCRNKKNGDYPNYGGRGISICERWSDFSVFYRDMGSRPSAAHSIDRIDVNGNYEPGNCRWATAKVQRMNQRRAA